jgi:pimeloyl-ACP methyl ester carboxylesterase
MIIASRLAEFMVEELWPFMGSIPCPTLIVRGEYSTFVSQDEAENMRQMIPKAEVAVIPRASHLPMIENQTAFKEAVFSFLD